MVNISVATEFSSARLSSDLARAGGLSARFGSAREISKPARVSKIGLIQAENLLIVASQEV